MTCAPPTATTPDSLVALDQDRDYQFLLGGRTITARLLALEPVDSIKRRVYRTGTLRPRRGQFAVVALRVENTSDAPTEASATLGRVLMLKQASNAYQRADELKGCETVSVSAARGRKGATSAEQDLAPGHSYTTTLVFPMPARSRQPRVVVSARFIE